jgi:hypothetical protein
VACCKLSFFEYTVWTKQTCAWTQRESHSLKVDHTFPFNIPSMFHETERVDLSLALAIPRGDKIRSSIITFPHGRATLWTAASCLVVITVRSLVTVARPSPWLVRGCSTYFRANEHGGSLEDWTYVSDTSEASCTSPNTTTTPTPLTAFHSTTVPQELWIS